MYQNARAESRRQPGTRRRSPSNCLALLATAVFLRISGYTLDLTDDAAFELTMSVASGELDVAGIEKLLRLAQARQ
jgi:prophage maintenance system killer protein